jgi:hypothetical protein
MTTFRYRPLDDDTVRESRETLRDAHGNALHVQISESDGNACRSCLRLTPHGTALILLAHRPFTTGGPYAETGPVFVHAEPCEPYRTNDEFPADFLSRTLVFRAYDTKGSIHDATLAAGDEADATLTRLFSEPEVAAVHVRSPAWGCFQFAVERV